MPSVSVDISVWCSCGNGLCNQSCEYFSGRETGIMISPCEYCLAKAKKEGFEEGREEGYEEGCKQREVTG